MSKITTVGLDLAKSVFQVHCADEDGKPVVRKRLRRSQVIAFFAALEPCLVAMEACAGAHHWARLLQGQGHDVRLIAPHYVKPFVKTNKNDAADAEAICEAVLRPTMRFAPVKSADQQAVLMMHRARELLMRQRTQLINALRGHCAEFGLVAARGACNVSRLIAIIEDRTDERIPDLTRETLLLVCEELQTTRSRIDGLEKRLKAWHRCNEAQRRRVQRFAPVLEIVLQRHVLRVAHHGDMKVGDIAVALQVGVRRDFRADRRVAEIAAVGLVAGQKHVGDRRRRAVGETDGGLGAHRVAFNVGRRRVGGGQRDLGDPRL